METVRIGALYVALLLAGDWASTPVRLFLIRTFGLQVAMLMMTPLIIGLAFFAARWALERLGPARTFSQRLVLALMPVLLIPPLESVLRFFVGAISLHWFLAVRDPVTRILLLAQFASCGVMPLRIFRPRRSAPLTAATPSVSQKLDTRAEPTASRSLGRHIVLLPAAASASGYAWLVDPEWTAFWTALIAGIGLVSVLVSLLAFIRHPRIVRLIYVFGVLITLAFAFVHPPWRAVHYDPNTGTHELAVNQVRAPLWSPPYAHDGQAFREVSIRWFFNSIREGDYVEPLIGFSFIHATLALAALGLVVGWWYRAPTAREMDSTLHIGLSISTTLLAGWLCLFVLAMMSMGYILDETEIIVGILAGSIVTGVVWAAWDMRRIRRQQPPLALPIAPAPVATGVPMAAADSRPEGPARASGHFGAALFWFVTGLLFACVVAAVLGAVTVSISGPVFGIDLGMSWGGRSADARVARGWVWAVLAVVVVAAGWMSAARFWWRRRAFAAGIAVGTAAIAVMILMLPGFVA